MFASTADGRRVVLRADATAAMGLGHVMRTAALGRELAAAGWSVAFCGSGLPADVVPPGEIEVVDTSPEPDPGPLLALDPDLAVVDGYHFTGGFFDALAAAGVPVVVIDDDGATPCRRPVAVVNQNPHADAGLYADLDGAPALLLGTDVALVRPEVVTAARRPRRQRRGVFVAFGGSDPHRLTVPVARTLAGLDHDVTVAIGPAHPDRAAVVAALAGGRSISVVEPADFVDALANAAVAVLGAGSSLWEAACLDTPTVAVVVAPNQEAPASAAAEQGLVCAVLAADDRLLDDLPGAVAAALSATRHPRRHRCDGARRVATALTELLAVRLRPATTDDARFLHRLRTDPEVAGFSFGPAPTWDEHVEWLTATLADPGRRLMIVEELGVPIGQVRLDAVADGHEVSISLCERRRGRGLARPVLDAAGEYAAGDLVARIARGNDRSVAAFERAGFVVERTINDVIHLRRRGTPEDHAREVAT